MFYLHVPKTGGQTLATRLASAFDPDSVHIMQSELVFPGDVKKLTKLLTERKFIESHVAGAMLKDRNEVPVLCTVREPISQMVSNWRHIRRDPANRWHRPAMSLTAVQFFDNFGDFFANHQSNYILSAFVDLRALTDQIGYYRAFNENFQKSLDRIRWLVPTESIDEFLDLWTIETKRSVPSRSVSLNIALESSAEVAEARSALSARPHLHLYDNLLYQIAKERHAEYKRATIESIVPWSYPDDSRRACRVGRGGVWLAENWYDPEISGDKRAWWSGPHRISEVRVWRVNGEKVLKFWVKGVNGIRYPDIVPKSKRTGQELRTVRRGTPDGEDGQGMQYSVWLEDLFEKDSILLVVPECYASIMTTTDDPSLVRRSFIASGWKLTDDERA